MGTFLLQILKHVDVRIELAFERMIGHTAYYFSKKALISRAEMPPATTTLLPLRRPPLPLDDAYALRGCVPCIFFPPGASNGIERRRPLL